jgi:hypothetical protein
MGGYTRVVSGQWLSKHVPQQRLNAQQWRYCWKMGISAWPMPRSYKANWGDQVSSVWSLWIVFLKCTTNYPLIVNKLLVIVTIYCTSTYSTDNYIMVNKEYICHFPSSKGSLAINMKLKHKENFCMAMLLFRIQQTTTLKMLHIFPISIILYHIKTLK